MAQTNLKTQHWKKNLVLIAKNTYVWMHQLSRKYGREITTLDQIPLDELSMLTDFGITGIWLIGIWERSRASKKIKSLYGFEHAAASAYSIQSYQIAQSIGGRSSFLAFREKAHSLGLKVGCDMVPNHTGLDSPWLIEHPEWYIKARENPSPDFNFTSPDLSPNPAVQIRIEDGYYDQTGAAEVFSYTNRDTGEERFIYHGNDGTSMPWNDTAQLNYLIPEVRHAVRETILEVAADFDIIRLDAAMTLTRQHYKRLWFPGNDGKRCTPTRETYKMSAAEFDQTMPQEFWMQVIDDIKKQQPDTLLMAEAFWLMEGYFINHIGMDRVYNSAFMNLLKNEENEQFKRIFREMSAIQQDTLEHLVNYQTTPDEDSAKHLFGTGEKYFGVCTLLATLPGLPMFGHGQLQGFTEKYGMDYLMPTMQENPDKELLKQHICRIKPLLKKRELFSSGLHFQLHNLQDQNGKTLDDVIIFSNKFENTSSLVVFNNSPNKQHGILNLSSQPNIYQLDNWQIICQNPSDEIRFIINPDLGEIIFDLEPYASSVYQSTLL